LSTEVRDEYIRALFDLSKSDPAKWATFLEAFKAYSAHELERSLSTQASDIAVSFGINRCLIHLRDDFIQVEALMNKLRKPSHGTI
jgi:hypothetical protein